MSQAQHRSNSVLFRLECRGQSWNRQSVGVVARLCWNLSTNASGDCCTFSVSKFWSMFGVTQKWSEIDKRNRAELCTKVWAGRVFPGRQSRANQGIQGLRGRLPGGQPLWILRQPFSSVVQTDCGASVRRRSMLLTELWNTLQQSRRHHGFWSERLRHDKRHPFHQGRQSCRGKCSAEVAPNQRSATSFPTV